MSRIDPSPRPSEAVRSSLAQGPLEDLLSDAEVEAIWRQLGHRWRRRRLPPGVTVRSMVRRSLSPDRSIAALGAAGPGPCAACGR